MGEGSSWQSLGMEKAFLHGKQGRRSRCSNVILKFDAIQLARWELQERVGMYSKEKQKERAQHTSHSYNALFISLLELDNACW